MILYRKAAQLRIRKAQAPEPPFWCRTTAAPYGPRRTAPVSIDYLSLHATAVERNEVVVSDDTRDELERTRTLEGPLLIDASGSAEIVFRRGETIASWCEESGIPALVLTSADGVLPSRGAAAGVIAIAAWPADPAALDALFATARDSGTVWGVVVPVLYPVTTELSFLETLAAAAQRHGAAFLASFSIDADAPARQALARTLALESDDDRYAMLFHGRVEPLQIATERHIAALAHQHRLRDSVLLPLGEERSNWNAAALLALVSSRMMAMELDLDLAGRIGRSARYAADLDKPLARIAEAASLDIVTALDEVSAGILTEWLAGNAEPGFVEYVNEQWRLARG